jgi:hypothetical protein
MSEIKIIKELREKVAISCRIIGNRGVTRGSFGHVSARIPGTKKILIKAKGPAEEALEFAGKRRKKPRCTWRCFAPGRK